VKKGRHRRYEEARALKQNQDLDLDSIFDSLEISDQQDDRETPADDGWADENTDEFGESLEESTGTA
jgi:hypothetical protein|tara:strand:+ start:3759 stop:3959 length:201 start_codon:yes stop_codon:yes gene_type:complete